jgi:hypothetical protein
MIVIHYERIRGLPSSGLMFFVWGTLSLSSFVIMYSKVTVYLFAAVNFNYFKIQIQTFYMNYLIINRN